MLGRSSTSGAEFLRKCVYFWTNVQRVSTRFSFVNGCLLKTRLALSKPPCPESLPLYAVERAFYVGDKIDLGIEILPMKTMQAEMSSGPGYYEGALYDVVRQGRGVPAVPLVLVGVVP